MRIAKDTKSRTKGNRKRYRIRHRKQITAAVVLFLAIAAAGGGIIYYINRRQAPSQYAGSLAVSYEKDGMDYFSEDYPEIYSEELRIIFGEDYKIGEKETLYMEGEECDCGYCSTGYQHDTWKVTYHDREGETFTQTIDNMYNLESLQFTWLKNHLAQYYDKKYVAKYFEEGILKEPSSDGHYCTVTIGIGGGSYTMDEKEEYDKLTAAGWKYREQLLASYQNKDTMLRLPELSYDKVYQQFPMQTTISLSIDDKELSGEEKAAHEEAVKSKVLDMIHEILKDTEHTCNLQVRVNSAKGYEDLYDGSRVWKYDILQGKQVELEGYNDYDRACDYLYKGIFW